MHGLTNPKFIGVSFHSG